MDEDLGTNGLAVMRYCTVVLVCVLMAAAASGCGETSSESRTEEEVVAERALRAALNGEGTGFVALVAPSFVAQVRAEMPDSDDETLGGVLVAGFLEDIPFSAVVDASFAVDAAGDEASVYVWGMFLDGSGMEMVIEESEAVRIPLLRENDGWYIDLLDL